MKSTRISFLRMNILIVLCIYYVILSTSFSVSHIRHHIPNRSNNYYAANKYFAHNKQRYKKEMINSNVVIDVVASNSEIKTIVIKAISKLIGTCSIGVIAASRGILDTNALSVISKLIFAVFQPCLLFTNVATTVSQLSITGGEGFKVLYILPLMALIATLIGYSIGSIFARIFYPNNLNSEEAKTLLACSAFGNSGPLPLVFADCLFLNHKDIHIGTKCISYISLYLSGWSPLFWIGAPYILLRDRSKNNDLTNNNISDNTNNTNKEFANNNNNNINTKQLLLNIKEKVSMIWKQICIPPVMDSFLGILVGLTPFLRNLIVSPIGILNPIFEAMKVLGKAYLPLVLMVLAGSLRNSFSNMKASVITTSLEIDSSIIEYKNSNDNNNHNNNNNNNNKDGVILQSKNSSIQSIIKLINSNKTFGIQIMTIYLIRFLLLPLFAFTIYELTNKHLPSNYILQYLKNDPILLFVLLLESIMPSAQIFTVVLQMHNKKEIAGRFAKLLLVLYIFGIPSLSFWLIKILQLTKVA